MKREHEQVSGKSWMGGGGGGGRRGWEEEDELLAVVGYKVRSSDMAEVAQKLEQLEEAMGSFQDEDTIAHHLSSETIHYNPSDIGTWIETMLSNFDSTATTTTTTTAATLSSDYDDLKAIPGRAIYAPDSPSSSKRTKTSSSTSAAAAATTDATRSVVLVDSQENGIRLVHALMACAEAVDRSNLSVAEALVKQIGYLAVSQEGAMRKVATYFAEGLARRIYSVYPPQPQQQQHFLSDSLQIHFYESCPYLKFAHFTANQAILEAFQGKSRVHVIDFAINQGMQWPALMQALALRPGGPPAFRLTGIGPPAPDNSDHLQQVGYKLAQLAESIHVQFEYRGFVANSLADLDASMLELRSPVEESVAVNSVFELHKLLARPGALEKVFSVIRQVQPEILTVVEQEASHNGPSFIDRFTESLHYYSALFDSLEGSSAVESQDKAMSEIYLGKQICNVVACDGVDRIERHETLTQWRTRFNSAGFSPVHLGSNAFKQASMLLALFAGGDGYRVEENTGCLTLGWHTRPLIATSAWQLASKSVVAH